MDGRDIPDKKVPNAGSSPWPAERRVPSHVGLLHRADLLRSGSARADCVGPGGAYHRARRERSVFCPADQERSLVQLDAAYAARMHALGNPEARIKLCSRWPERQACARDCLEQIHLAA